MKSQKEKERAAAGYTVFGPDPRIPPLIQHLAAYIPSLQPLLQKYGIRIDVCIVESDRSIQETATYHASVVKELLRPPRNMLAGGGLMVRHGLVQVKPRNTVFFTAIYLMPGDYHWFHSLMVWVVKKWQHFQGTYVAHAQSPFSIYGLRILL